MSKAVIISAGTITDYEYIKTFISEEDFVICADGGLLHAEKMGVVPNLTVGDFDSYRGDLSGDVRRFNPEKDYTDTHIAVSCAIEKGYREIILLGCIGTRMDHTLANIGLLEYALNNGCKGCIVNENNIITVIEGVNEITRDDFKYVSLIPIGNVKGVTLQNLKYTLDNYNMTFSESIGISNEFTQKDAVIKITEGRLILIKSKD